MKSTILVLLGSALTFLYIAYPAAPKGHVVDTYAKGVPIIDSLRILEDDNDPRTKDFVTAQQALTEQYLLNIPGRDTAFEKMLKLSQFDRYQSITLSKSGAVFYLHNPGGAFPQARLYRKTGINADEAVFDPLTLDKTAATSLAEYAVSDDERYVALALSRNGSDWRTVRILDLTNGRLLADSVKYVKFSALAWFEEGFYYNGFPPTEELQPSKNAALKYHVLGTPQAEDKIILQHPDDPNMLYGAKVKHNRWLVVEAGNSTSNNALYLKDLKKKNSRTTAIRPVMDKYEYQVLGFEDNRAYILTNEGAENNRIISAAIEDNADFSETIPEHASKPLAGAWLMDGELVLHYLADASSFLAIHDLRGRFLKDIDIPAYSTLTSFEANDNLAAFTVESFLAPTSAYLLEPKKGHAVSLLFEVKSPLSNVAEFEITRIQAKSKDGTSVPAFVVAKKGLKKDACNPTLLYGYGGFNISVTPRYRLLFAAWLEAGGTLVVANLRGGGEFGHAWHRAGTKTQKQHVFDDFIAVAEYLINNRYTRPELLAINGASNGGLLVAATMLQRPDLFGVAIPQVGVLDMLRYNTSSGGALWEPDYGSPAIADEFDALHAYSPVHNVRSGKYPATIITTGKTDTRVAPWHSFKFAALLQEQQLANHPILLRIDSGGHGPGRTVKEAAREVADVLAFTLHNMGIDL